MSYALAPIIDGLRAIFGTSTPLPGLMPGLIVTAEANWHPATDLGGPLLEPLLTAAARHWQAKPPAAAALAWKAYTHWVCLPPVLGWLTARRIPSLTATNVLVRLDQPPGLPIVGLRATTPTFILPGDLIAGAPDPVAGGRDLVAGGPDPVAVGLGLAASANSAAGGAHLAAGCHSAAGGPDPAVTVVPDETALLAAFRRSLLDEHLRPLLDIIGRRVRLGPRTLLGSVAATIAADVLRFRAADGAADRAADVTAGPAAEIESLLGALGLDGLIDLSTDDRGLVSVRRRTCCLAFTLPRPRLCRDCCLRPGPIA